MSQLIIPYSLYGGIPNAIRYIDAQDDALVLERFLRGPQEERDRTSAAIADLPQQISPISARGDLLIYLKDIVGLTKELDTITSRLTNTQLRRLIQVAVPLWNERYTERGIANAIRLLTGKHAYITNWFGYRWVIDETAFDTSSPWIIGSESTEQDENWTSIKIMDDGSLDELLLLDILRLMRASGEHIEVLLLDFLDLFDRDLSQWHVTAGIPILYEGQLQLAPGSELRSQITVVPAAELVSYELAVKFSLSAAAVLIVRWYDDSMGNYYEATLQKGEYPGGTPINVKRYNSGVPTVLLSGGAAGGLAEGVDYLLRITTLTSSGVNTLRMAVDGNQALPSTDSSDYTDSTATPTFGNFQLSSSGGAVMVSNVESHRLPARYATIGIRTLDEPGGAAIISGNFNQ